MRARRDSAGLVLVLATIAGIGLAARSAVAKGPADTTVVRSYAVADLVLTPEQSRRIAETNVVGSKEAGQFNALVDLLQTAVEPDSWTRRDARGLPIVEPGRVSTMTPFYLNASLIVRAAPEVHERIATLLDQIRKLPALNPARGERS